MITESGSFLVSQTESTILVMKKNKVIQSTYIIIIEA